MRKSKYKDIYGVSEWIIKKKKKINESYITDEAKRDIKKLLDINGGSDGEEYYTKSTEEVEIIEEHEFNAEETYYDDLYKAYMFFIDEGNIDHSYEHIIVYLDDVRYRLPIKECVTPSDDILYVWGDKIESWESIVFNEYPILVFVLEEINIALSPDHFSDNTLPSKVKIVGEKIVYNVNQDFANGVMNSQNVNELTLGKGTEDEVSVTAQELEAMKQSGGGLPTIITIEKGSSATFTYDFANYDGTWGTVVYDNMKMLTISIIHNSNSTSTLSVAMSVVESGVAYEELPTEVYTRYKYCIQCIGANGADMLLYVTYDNKLGIRPSDIER